MELISAYQDPGTFRLDDILSITNLTGHSVGEGLSCFRFLCYSSMRSARDSKIGSNQFSMSMGMFKSSSNQLNVVTSCIIKMDTLLVMEGFPLEFIEQIGHTVLSSVHIREYVHDLLHGHSLARDVYLNLTSQLFCLYG